MLALFRTNQIATALPLAVWAVLWHLPGMMGWIPSPEAPTGSGWLFDELGTWTYTAPFWSALAAAGVVFAQALLVNWICNESRITLDRDWVPAMIYVLVVSCLREFQYLSPPLLATTFVLLAMRRAFAAYKSGDVSLAIFDTGFCVAIAGLIYPLSWWLWVGFFLGLLLIRVFRLREQVVFLTGVFVPGFLGWTWAFVNSRGTAFRYQHGSNLFDLWTFRWTWLPQHTVATALLSVMLLVVLFNYNNYLQQRAMQVRKFVGALFWIIAVVCVSFVLLERASVKHFLLAGPSVGICLGMTFQGIKRTWLAELLHFLLAGAAVGAMLFL
jgi:hypothetical protein